MGAIISTARFTISPGGTMVARAMTEDAPILSPPKNTIEKDWVQVQVPEFCKAQILRKASLGANIDPSGKVTSAMKAAKSTQPTGPPVTEGSITKEVKLGVSC